MLTGLDYAMDDADHGPSRYRCGDLEIDVGRHRVLRGGTELALEPKAYGVLLELVRRRGGVVTRDALLDAVWGHRHVTPAVLNRILPGFAVAYERNSLKSFHGASPRTTTPAIHPP